MRQNMDINAKTHVPSFKAILQAGVTLSPPGAFAKYNTKISDIVTNDGKLYLPRPVYRSGKISHRSRFTAL